jgi:hypothetical protein
MQRFRGRAVWAVVRTAIPRRALARGAEPAADIDLQSRRKRPLGTAKTC